MSLSLSARRRIYSSAFEGDPVEDPPLRRARPDGRVFKTLNIPVNAPGREFTRVTAGRLAFAEPAFVTVAENVHMPTVYAHSFPDTTTTDVYQFPANYLWMAFPAPWQIEDAVLETGDREAGDCFFLDEQGEHKLAVNLRARPADSCFFTVRCTIRCAYTGDSPGAVRVVLVHAAYHSDNMIAAPNADRIPVTPIATVPSIEEEKETPPVSDGVVLVGRRMLCSEDVKGLLEESRGARAGRAEARALWAALDDLSAHAEELQAAFPVHNTRSRGRRVAKRAREDPRDMPVWEQWKVIAACLECRERVFPAARAIDLAAVTLRQGELAEAAGRAQQIMCNLE